MESSKIYAYLFICMLFISSVTPILGCGYCGKPTKHKPGKKPKTPTTPKTPSVPPRTPLLPPIIVKPPPVTLPPITVPPIPLPPVTVPPILNPPSTPGKGGNSPCPPPQSPAQATCPIDTLKLGACVDLLGGLVHIGVGDPVANQCCPVLQGLVELEAAVCLCTTLKLKLLNLNIYVPLALQLLVACGKSPPPGYTCSL
ncbi:36.4 kDa proline-rich protein isoform X2 [Abrus precatorius]|uniref:36.4 kDa proline-rich protein isoform X2 n=1 Tax=Abrus precatorius TaxID=3816 RepID=A0A8B8JJ10_ABRPR|nr:36.4 kDa proline-rich protein isoform X2 [Abrus precatorius]